MEAAMQYDRTFNDMHDVSGMLVYTLNENKDSNAGSLHASLPGRNMGLAGRFTYGLLERYFPLSLTLVSTALNVSTKITVGGSSLPVALDGWFLMKASIKNTTFSKYVNKLKLKGSYGLVGNDNIADERFFYLSEVNMNNSDRGAYFGTEFNKGYSGISFKRYANPHIDGKLPIS